MPSLCTSGTHQRGPTREQGPSHRAGRTPSFPPAALSQPLPAIFWSCLPRKCRSALPHCGMKPLSLRSPRPLLPDSQGLPDIWLRPNLKPGPPCLSRDPGPTDTPLIALLLPAPPPPSVSYFRSGSAPCPSAPRGQSSGRLGRRKRPYSQQLCPYPPSVLARSLPPTQLALMCILSRLLSPPSPVPRPHRCQGQQPELLLAGEREPSDLSISRGASWASARWVSSPFRLSCGSSLGARSGGAVTEHLVSHVRAAEAQEGSMACSSPHAGAGGGSHTLSDRRLVRPPVRLIPRPP